MNFVKQILGVSSLVLVGCSSSQNADLAAPTHKHKDALTAPYETIKPGAAIAFSPALPARMTPGQFHAINMRFEEAYDSGSMSVNLDASDGLEIFGQTTEKSFLMIDKANHDWPIDIRAEQDGIYFISVFTTTEDQQTNFISQRSFSIRLDIGDITQEMIAQAFPENGTLSADGKTRALQAQETIR